MARPRRTRATVTVLALGALVAGLTGCTASAPEPDASGPATPTSEASPEPSPAPAVSPAPTPETTDATTDAAPSAPTDAPTAVRLTGTGIGDVTRGSDAYDALVAALGAPTEPLRDYCVGAARMAEWGGLTAYLHTDGTLIGWSLEPGPLPDVVRPTHDIRPGDPLARVLALGGVPEPVTQPEDSGRHVTTVEDVTWWSEGAAPEAPVTVVTAHAPGCS